MYKGVFLAPLSPAFCPEEAATFPDARAHVVQDAFRLASDRAGAQTASMALRPEHLPASVCPARVVADASAALDAGRWDARARCRVEARDCRLAKDHGFLSSGVVLLVELAHSDARAHWVAQVRRQQQVLRQKVANSPGRRRPAWLPAFRAVLQELKDESGLRVLRVSPRPEHREARELGFWEQFSERRARQPEAPQYELREPLVSPPARQVVQRGQRASRQQEPHALAAVRLQEQEDASAPLSRLLPSLLSRPWPPLPPELQLRLLLESSCELSRRRRQESSSNAFSFR